MDSTLSSTSVSSTGGFRLPFVVAFFALTLLPLGQMVLRLPSGQPVDENRALAAAPPPIWKDPFEWVKQADAWFGDHFGFRSLLIRTKTQIDYSVFNTSTRVHIGSDNRLFYRAVMDVEKPMIQRYLKESSAVILDNVRLLHAALAARGIRLALSINLMADRYFPETLPASVPYYPPPYQIDDLIARLNAQLGDDFLDLSPILRDVEKRRSIFYRTDAHWTNPAAGEAAKVLVNRWARLLGREPLWTREVAERPIRFSGGIARFMPLFFTPEETTIEIQWNFTGPPGMQSFSNDGLFESGHRNSQPHPELLPTALMLGDSFTDAYLVAGMPIYFQNFYRIRWAYGLKISRVIESMPADTRLFLLQFIETSRFGMDALADTADIKRAVELIEKRPTIADTNAQTSR